MLFALAAGTLSTICMMGFGDNVRESELTRLLYQLKWPNLHISFHRFYLTSQLKKHLNSPDAKKPDSGLSKSPSTIRVIICGPDNLFGAVYTETKGREDYWPLFRYGIDNDMFPKHKFPLKNNQKGYLILRENHEKNQGKSSGRPVKDNRSTFYGWNCQAFVREDGNKLSEVDAVALFHIVKHKVEPEYLQYQTSHQKKCFQKTVRFSLWVSFITIIFLSPANVMLFFMFFS